MKMKMITTININLKSDNKMPSYTFRNKETNEVWVDSMSIDQKQEYLNNNKDIEQVLVPVAFGDSVRMGVRKPDSNFRDVLKEIKKHHPHGKGINTF